jgi:hypothetical protein|tara:strand:- start:530 stop:907 length:378 start_codon:yes stop_codon:yes gene_type:complete
MSEIEEVVKDLAIRQFKLMNGDEIVGLVANHNETNFVLDRPFRVIPNKLKNDAYQLVPWFDLSLSNTFTIHKSMVVAHADVATSIKETYLKFAISLDKEVTNIDHEEETSEELPNLIPNEPETIH